MSIWYGVTSPLGWRKDREGGRQGRNHWGRIARPRFSAQASTWQAPPQSSLQGQPQDSTLSHSTIPPPTPKLIQNHFTWTYCTSPWKWGILFEYSHGCKSSLFLSFIDYQHIQALELQWNPCGENPLKPATECTQSKEKGKEYEKKKIKHCFLIIKLQI